MTITSLPEKVTNGYRIQIRMKAGWKDSLTWPKVYFKREAIDLARMLNNSGQNDWRAVRCKS